LRKEFFLAILKCGNDSTSGPDKLSWRYIKKIIKDMEYLNKIINIANVYIELGYWPSIKTSISIIIPKSNKKSYDIPKTFRLIVLLNTLGKLIEKVIGKKLQFQVLSKEFIHSCQLGGLKQHSTVDADIVLIYLIHVEWVKNYLTSILAFNVTQFFPSLNLLLLSLILNKVGFNSRVSHFFENYLVGRKTKYF